MSRTKLSIEDGQLLFCCEDAGVDDRRPLEGDDHGRFEQWGTAYRHACGQRDAAEKLLELGREMFDWLDGGGRWIERARAAARPPWLVEFSVALHPSVVEGAFLEAPWELLADGADHLAADTELIYCPIRRLAPPAEPEPPSESRLSMVFMAAAPEEQVTLSYEAEEAAILRATGSIGLDLTVEETGTLPLLGECVARESLSGRLDVLHISCHGTLDPEPRLLLEDDEGGPAPATAEEVCDTLGEHRPRLLCLSACETAASDRLLGSLAAGMIRRGFPAVLGWSGKVRDAAATEFAADLYAQLARFQPLETALARARLKLLRPQPGALEKKRSEDWHLARLFLGPGGGGVLCRGTRARHRRDAEYAYKTFLNERDQQVPVAGINEFVGRRRQIQRVLRVFRQGSHAGVLVHGMGRQGKSSLAARIAHRLHQHTLVVLHGAYDAQTVLRAFDRFVRGDEVRAIVGRHEAPVGDDPAVLYQALCELLEGPCRQYVHPSADGPGRGPVLLVIDDFEQALEAARPGTHLVKPGLVAAAAAVINAFGDSDTESRLMLTSRYAFTLPIQGRDVVERLDDLLLPAMQPYEAEKQVQAKLKLSKDRKRVPDSRRTERIIELARGNPGLQDLLFSMSLHDERACQDALEAMQAYLDRGQAPEQAEVLEFLEDLALDRLIGLLSAGEKELLRGSSLFESPVPREVLSKMAAELGAPQRAVGHLCGLGLWELHADPVAPATLAAILNALVRPRAGALKPAEQRALARLVVEDLFQQWGGAAGRRRPYTADLQLARLALLAANTTVLCETADDAIRALQRDFDYRAAAELGQRAVTVLDQARAPVPIGLLRTAGDACGSTGETGSARTFYGRALAELQRLPDGGGPDELEDRAAVLISHARQLVQDGDPDQALGVFQRAGRLLEGDRFRRERAVTLGDIAGIMTDKGQVDEALRLHQEQIELFEQLGDVDGRAHVLWGMAGIQIEREDYQAALGGLGESYAILLKLGRLDGICYVGLDLGQLLAAAGQKEEAVAILTRSRDGFRQLQQPELARRVEELLSQIEGSGQ